MENKINYWLISFNGMSAHVGLFYAYRLGNRIHCMFIFIILMFLKVIFFTYGPIEYD